MKKVMKITAILVALLFAGSLFGYDDEPAPGRSRRGFSPLNQTLSIGLFAAYHLSTTYKLNDVEQSTTDVNDKYFGLGARIYPFMGGKLGFGIDMLLLDSAEFIGVTYSRWLVDFNALLRFQVGRNLTVNGSSNIFSVNYFSRRPVRTLR